jgi:hypothetical protein
VVNPSIDQAYQTVLRRWAHSTHKSTNFQLHPPVRRNGNLVTNECGNLELPLMFQADEEKDGSVLVKLYEQNDLPLCILHECLDNTETNKRKTKKNPNGIIRESFAVIETKERKTKKNPLAQALILPFNDLE